MTEAIAYIRFSTPKQEHGDSIERQTRAIERFCLSQGWTVVETVTDLGRSAWKGDHLRSGYLRRLTDRVLDREFDNAVIVVEELDRLSRQGHEAVGDWLRSVTGAGVRVAVAGTGRVYDRESLRSNIIDGVEILIRGKLAQDESDRKSGLVRAAWEGKFEAVRSGAVLTKGCPGWLEPVDGGTGDDGTSFRIIGERAEVIRQVYEWSADGDGLQTIVKHLNARYSSWGRSGNGFNVTQIKRWLVAASVEGDFIPYEADRLKPNGERVVGYYPRIVQADLVRRARDALKSRSGTGGPRRTSGGYSNIFMGLFRCSECHSKVVVKRTNGPGYMRCQSAELGRQCSNNRLYRFRDFERAAVPVILRLGLDDRFLRHGSDVAGASEADAQAKKRVADLATQMANLTGLMSRVADATALIEQYDALSVELTDAKAKAETAAKALAKARGQVDEVERLKAAREIGDAIHSDDPALRLKARQRVHEAARAIVTKIICEPDDDHRGSPEPTMTMAILGGLHAVKISNRGEIIGEVSPLASVEDDPRLAVGAVSKSKHSLDDVQRVVARSRARA